TAKPRHLRARTAPRREAARRDRERLAPLRGTSGTPSEPPWAYAVYHLFVIRTPDRDALQAHLAEAGIGTGIHYPIPLHLQEAYQHLGFGKGNFPVSERIAGEILSLPT